MVLIILPLFCALCLWALSKKLIPIGIVVGLIISLTILFYKPVIFTNTPTHLIEIEKIEITESIYYDNLYYYVDDNKFYQRDCIFHQSYKNEVIVSEERFDNNILNILFFNKSNQYHFYIQKNSLYQKKNS